MAQHRLVGTIHDKENDAGIAYATVALLDAERNYIAGTVSNESGAFDLKNIKPGSYSVEVSYVGYEKAAMSVGVPAVGDMRVITLAPEVNTIGEVVVTARTRSSGRPRGICSIHP